MSRAGAALACTLLFGCGAEQVPDPPPNSAGVGTETVTGYRADPDMGALAGEWVEAESKASYRFAGTSLMVTRPGQPVQPLAYTLDSRERPKRITLRRLDGSTSQGVYEVDGRRLRIAVAPNGRPTPTDFAETPAIELWTLERAN